VDARKNDGVDCASAKQPVSDLPLFVSRLNSLTGEAVSPLVEGVRHRAISAGVSGLAVSLIPSSDIGPHMAKLGEDRYYKRSGDSFYRMEHYDVSDMFGRRRRPKLHLEVVIAARGVTRSGWTVTHQHSIALFVTNEGRASARNLFARVKVSPPYSFGTAGPEADGRGGMKLLSDRGRDGYFGGDAHLVIHPGMRQGIVAIAFSYSSDDPRLPDLEIEVELAADDVQLQRDARTITWASIYEVVRAAPTE
jgi:hypothetical protein